MKKILKSSEYSELSRFRRSTPDATWDDLKNTGNIYSQIKQQCWQDQRGLCAYCEKKTIHELDQQIEHFHQKSDSSGRNWALDWQNMFAVCNGGQNPALEGNLANYYPPLPENLSCDTYKNRMVQKGYLKASCEGYILNPLQIIHTPALFKFDPTSGYLIADETACQAATIIPNHFGNTMDLVNSTIKMLNLNCDRLSQIRIKIWRELQKKKANYRQKNIRPRVALAQLANHTFSQQWPSFFTTWRIVLNSYAEEHLKGINYQG